MRTVLLCLLQTIVMAAAAQRECASFQYRTEQQATNSNLKQQAVLVESFIARQQTVGSVPSLAKVPAGIIRIPVVIHVLEANGIQGVSDDLINSQIAALNRDFRRKNADTIKTPNHFKSVAADVEIEFALATADPKGRATNGIIRKQTTVTQWEMDDNIKFSSKGGDNAWDPNSYLNIWVGPMRRILGYASEPGGPLEKDGIVINPSAFGVTGGGSYGLGRTATHEVGHWLGLRHIWGDTYCGDDLVADTPPQSSFTSGCPSGIRISCGNGSNGNMYMNFMDFAEDPCMNLFTIGQKNRMRAWFADGGPRNGLIYSKGLNAPWSTEPPDEIIVKDPTLLSGNAKLYPNPAIDNVVLKISNYWVGKEVVLYNMNNVVVKRILITSTEQRIPLNTLTKGIYILKAGYGYGDQVLYEKIVKL